MTEVSPEWKRAYERVCDWAREDGMRCIRQWTNEEVVMETQRLVDRERHQESNDNPN